MNFLLRAFLLGTWMFAYSGCHRQATVLTKENASQVIPTGMSESEVIRLLGKPLLVTENLGDRYLRYYPKFVGADASIELRVNTITVVVRNGTVNRLEALQ